jgi:hypothetical protein
MPPADRWTPLLVRELLAGSRHFNEIQRGLPGRAATSWRVDLRGTPMSADAKILIVAIERTVRQFANQLTRANQGHCGRSN